MNRVFFIIFLINLTFIFLKFNAGYSHVELIDRVIATVNGKIITEAELQREVRIVKKEVGKENKDLEKKVLQQMIDNSLLEQEAEKESIKVSPLEVEKAVEKIKKNFSKERFLQILSEQGISLDELKEKLKGQILRERLLSKKANEIRQGIRIREEEVRNFYQRLKAYLQGEGKKEEDIIRFYQRYQEKLKQVQIAQIVVKGKDKAQRISYLLEKGKDFSTMAENFSLTPEAKEGGNLGWFSFFQIKPSLREEILKLKKGDVSKMLKIKDDYYRFIKVKDKRELLFSKWRQKVKDYLSQIKIEEAIQNWIAKLRSKSQIIIIEPSLQ